MEPHVTMREVWWDQRMSKELGASIEEFVIRCGQEYKNESFQPQVDVHMFSERTRRCYFLRFYGSWWLWSMRRPQICDAQDTADVPCPKAYCDDPDADL